MLTRSFFYYSKILLSFLLTVSLGGNSFFAQTKQRSAARNSSNQSSGKKCDGAWSGVVSYKRVLKTEYAEGTSEFAKRNFVGASSEKKSSREVVYEGKIILDGKADANIPQYGMSVAGQYIGATQQKGKVSANVSENENRSAKSVTRDNCGANDTRDKTCESTETSKATANFSGESNFGLTFQNGFYNFSFNFPETNTTKTIAKQSSCKNFCQGRNNGGGSTNETFPVRFEQERVSVKNQKYDPKNADRLQGSQTETSSDGKTVTTISWNLRKCAAPLQIIDLKLEHHIFPNPDEWIAVGEQTGTIDGNRVKVKATVFNSTPTEQNVTVNFTETKENIALQDGKVTEKIGAGETKEVEYLWDTNGFAWTDSAKPQSEREIKAEIEGDSKTEKIKIIPKPVILAHGLWSNASAWTAWHGFLREAHSFAWDAFPVGEDPFVAKMNTGDHPANYEPTNTIYQNAQELAKEIKWVREQKNAWHVDLVAHSMGGLISRQYIDTMMPQVFDGKPEVTHLVMLGTPNMGSPCANLVGTVFEFFGEKNMHAMRELRPSVAADFNKRVNQRRGVKFSILIGYAIPVTCHHDLRGDGVVALGSAGFNLTDIGFVDLDHVSLTNEGPFKNFVLPRLAVGPKKAKAEQTAAWFENLGNDNFAFADSNENNSFGFTNFFQKVSYHRAENGKKVDETNSDDITTKQKIVLKAKQAQEIEIPASAGKTGVLIVASPEVAATLTDASGKIIGKSEGGIEALKSLFRIIFSDETTANQTLKLKLENLGTNETTVFIAGFAVNAKKVNFTVEAGKPNPAGVVPLRAKLSENNASVSNAKITAKINGQSKEITFFDDGKHSDGAAGDGVYGASVEKLPKGDYLLEAAANAANGKTLSASAVIKIEK